MDGEGEERPASGDRTERVEVSKDVITAFQIQTSRCGH